MLVKNMQNLWLIRFNEAGIPSLALTDESKKEERNNAKERLVNGEIKFIFVVDII